MWQRNIHSHHCYVCVFDCHTAFMFDFDCAMQDEIPDAGLTRAPNEE
jgi:hypothetical protein